MSFVHSNDINSQCVIKKSLFNMTKQTFSTKRQYIRNKYRNHKQLLIKYDKILFLFLDLF